MRNLLPSIVFASTTLVALGAAHAQDVTYQENLGGGDSAVLTLQNYTLGSALDKANFVSFSLVTNGSSTSIISSQFFNPENFSNLSGSISLANPASDSITFGITFGYAYSVLELDFSQQNDLVTTTYECGTCGNGKGARMSLVVLPLGVGFQPTSAPEMDLNSAGSALTLLLGGVLVIRGGFRRS